MDTWRGDVAADGNPAEYHNGTNLVLVLGGTNPMQPGQFALHPGPGDEYAVARYVAPATGVASIDAAFSGLDVYGTTTDVHVLLNGTALFDGAVGVVVPEPATLALVGLGFGALAASRSRRHSRPRALE